MNISSDNMEDKVVIVTGSSAGIGAATAVLLASKGARVTLHGRRENRLAEIAEQCRKASPLGHEPCVVAGDITDVEVRARLVKQTLDAFGKIDGLINNAGYVTVGGWEKEDLEMMRKMLEVHVVAPYDLSRLCLPHLVKSKGAIVNVSSVAGVRGVPGSIAYCAGKHAMEGMMKALASEVAKLGVRINNANPGFIATEILTRTEISKSDTQVYRSDPSKYHPNGRTGEPNEVAECLVFLVSPASSMVTGTSMPIDGGMTSSLLWR